MGHQDDTFGQARDHGAQEPLPKVLITGADGFIGRWVQRCLSRRGMEWAAFDGDVLDRQAFERYQDCEAVIHLAARVRDTGAPQELIRVNTEGTQNALEFAAAGGRRFIFASSYLYGVPREQPIKETHPTAYTNPYSFSKWQAEHLVRAWHEFFGISGVCFRMFNPYGPGQPPGFLVSDVFDGLRQGRMVLKDLTSRRDFVFVEDVAELMVRAVAVPHRGIHVVNVGSGKSHSALDLVEEVFRVVDYRVPVESHDLPVTISDTVADITRARDLYGWQPRTPFADGVRRVAASLGLMPGEAPAPRTTLTAV